MQTVRIPAHLVDSIENIIYDDSETKVSGRTELEVQPQASVIIVLNPVPFYIPKGCVAVGPRLLNYVYNLQKDIRVTHCYYDIQGSEGAHPDLIENGWNHMGEDVWIKNDDLIMIGHIEAYCIFIENARQLYLRGNELVILDVIKTFGPPPPPGTNFLVANMPASMTNMYMFLAMGDVIGLDEATKKRISDWLENHIARIFHFKY